MKRSTSDVGKWVEDIAAQYLEKKSYQILFRNWRALRGDIDIIALDGTCVVFVEVKGGFSKLYGPPELRITEGKKHQLYKLASLFLVEVDQYHIPHDHYRFDVVIIDGHPNKYDIRHYENAFYI
jgi:putative endonuclease